MSTKHAVTPLITIGHGWSNSNTEAKSGMKLTDVLTFANGILRKNESLRMPRIANAARAFQYREGKGPGHAHSPLRRRKPAAETTTAIRA